MNSWYCPLNCNILDDAENTQLALLRFMAGLILREGILPLVTGISEVWQETFWFIGIPDLKSPIYIPVFMKVFHILASLPLKVKTLPISSLYIDKISYRKCLRTNAVFFKREIQWRWRMLHYRGLRNFTVDIKRLCFVMQRMETDCWK